MRIAIIASGSRGDVQPYLGLGRGLSQAGHAVRLVTNENFQALVRAHGLEYWRLSGNVQAVVESPEMRAKLETGNFLAVMGLAAKAMQAAALLWAEEGLEACREVDLIMAGLGGLFVGIAIAEKLGLPLMQAHYVPFTPTGAFPGALLPPQIARLGPAANRLSHHLTRQVMWQQARSADGPARQRVLGLPPAPFWGPYRARPLQGMPVLYGISPAVIAKPADWDANTHVTGFWFSEAGADPAWTPPPAVQAFLEAGAPPVYVGFGSMTTRQPEETARLVVQALAQTGQRAILVSGWGGLQAEALPDNVLVLESIPHDWLFQRVAAVVHHGGAGTTAAGLRAGVPSIVIPFFADQPFWGQRVADLGVGPQPIPRARLTVQRLAAAINAAVTDADLRGRAAALGATIRAEDGVARAVAVVGALEAQRQLSAQS
jgi:sterol 3beta-glucosyltransferase